MRPKPFISGRAETDLSLQYCWYRDNAGVELAERFLAAFDATVELLGRHPELGRPRWFRDAALAGLRSLGVGGRFGVHLIFYRCSGENVSIERIMHGSRDLPCRLVEAPGDYPPPI